MSIRQILEDLRDLLASDQTLIDYCIATFGKEQTVFLGYNWQDPPTEQFWPAIIIALIEKHEVRNSRKRDNILVAFYSGREDVTDGTNAKTFEGFLDNEELREKVEVLVLENRSSFGKIDIDASTENPLFPMFATTTTFEIENIFKSRRP